MSWPDNFRSDGFRYASWTWPSAQAQMWTLGLNNYIPEYATAQDPFYGARFCAPDGMPRGQCSNVTPWTRLGIPHGASIRGQYECFQCPTGGCVQTEPSCSTLQNALVNNCFASKQFNDMLAQNAFSTPPQELPGYTFQPYSSEFRAFQDDGTVKQEDIQLIQ